MTVTSTLTCIPLLSPVPCHPLGVCQSVSVVPTLYCFHGQGNIPPGGRLLPVGDVVPVRSWVSNPRFTEMLVTWASPDWIAMTNLPLTKS